MHKSSKDISFLYLSFLDYGRLYTDLHLKATDCHQYLEYKSSHSDHTKKSTVYTQALHLSRLCSFEEDFECNKSNMRSGVLKRRYPEGVIDK